MNILLTFFQILEGPLKEKFDNNKAPELQSQLLKKKKKHSVQRESGSIKFTFHLKILIQSEVVKRFFPVRLVWKVMKIYLLEAFTISTIQINWISTLIP